MFKYLFLLIIILNTNIPVCDAGSKYIIEAATGFGSKYFPFSSEWKYSVDDYGSQYNEYAIKGTYLYRKALSTSLTVGWLEDKNYISYGVTPDSIPSPAFVGWHKKIRKVYYIVPSATLSTSSFRIDVGAIIFKTYIEDNLYAADRYDYPFDGNSGIRPAGGLELGARDAYVFGRFFNSFPLYSGGGGIEIGIGGRSKKGYEHKLYYSMAPHLSGLGYRGEVRIRNNTGIMFGLSLGSKYFDFRRSQSAASMLLGVKTSL